MPNLKANYQETGHENDQSKLINQATEDNLNNDKTEGKEENFVSEDLDNKKDDNHLDDLKRLQAEYLNYRKRVERDRSLAGEIAKQNIIEELMPVLDDIDAARSHGDLKDGPFAAIAKKLEKTLDKFNLVRYEDLNEPFNPLYHEALIKQESSDTEKEIVFKVLRPGYKLNDKVIRAAQVIVSVPKE